MKSLSKKLLNIIEKKEEKLEDKCKNLLYA